MPWKDSSIVSLRTEFVMLANEPGSNISALAKRFGISRTAAYKWLNRYRAAGTAGLADRPRTPKSCPGRTSESVEKLVLQVRDDHQSWGGRKIRAYLVRKGHRSVPAPSTVTAILHRSGRIDPEESLSHQPFTSFERDRPNELWQMDFKGYFKSGKHRIHSLGVLDDHSRNCVCLQPCLDQQTATVKQALVRAFRENGLPECILCDNGSPWGDDRQTPHTKLGVWLMRLGVRVIHGRPCHPQTQGKLERFNRTLMTELIRKSSFELLEQWQEAFETFRVFYNCERPHESLGDTPPVERYQPSPRAYPEILPAVIYDDGLVRSVQVNGHFSFRGISCHLSKAFAGEIIALKETESDGCYDVIYCGFRVASVDPRNPTQTVNHVSERL